MARRRDREQSRNNTGDAGTEKKAEGFADWFRMKDDKSVASAIQEACQSLSFTQLGIQQRNLRNAVLWGGFGYVSGMRYSGAAMPAGGMMNSAVLSQGRMGPALNLVNSVINTIMSRILAAGEPAVSFVTNRGDFEQQHKAELLDQYCEGLFEQTNFSKTTMKVLMDCLLFGTGVTKIGSDADNNITAERVFVNEMWVEGWGGREGRPRSMFQIGTCDRDVLANKYPKFRKQIMDSRSMHPMDQSIATSMYTNEIPVWEAYHLGSPKPDGKTPDDGRHCVCIAGEHLIVDEKWEQDDYPYVFLRFQDVPEGFWGMGAAELLWGFQTSLNNACHMEYLAHAQMSIPRMYIRADSGVNENKILAGKSGLVVSGTGPAPEVLSFPATTTNFVEYKNFLIQSAYQFLGVSLLQAQGVKPDGLDSGVAIRDYNETADGRFSLLSHRLGAYYVEAAEKLVGEAVRVYGKTGKMSVRVKGKTFVDSIDWKDIDLDRDEYTIQVWETSALPRSPAGRLNMTGDLIKAGMLTPDEGRKLLAFPDLNEALDLDNAPEDYADFVLYKLLHTDEFPTPDPLSNIPMVVKTVQNGALRAIMNNAPIAKINKCRIFLQQAKALLLPKPQPVVPPTAPAVPQAKPTATPSSPLLPNAAPPGLPQ